MVPHIEEHSPQVDEIVGFEASHVEGLDSAHADEDVVVVAQEEVVAAQVMVDDFVLSQSSFECPGNVGRSKVGDGQERESWVDHDELERDEGIKSKWLRNDLKQNEMVEIPSHIANAQNDEDLLSAIN